MTYKILHVSLEYTYGVGGLKTVLTGLLPVLQANGLNITIATPYYEFLKHSDLECEPLGKITHIYKQLLHTSIIFKAINKNPIETNNIVQHYLISPDYNSDVSSIFNIDKQQNIYQAFDYSEPQNRLEYFNGAIASLVKIKSPDFPVFDVVQTHTWHTSLSICLIKEFENLTWTNNNTYDPKQVNPLPKIINTIHMLSNEQGLLVGKKEIVNTLKSVGLPLDPKLLINHKNLNQMYLGLQYADQILMVSNSFANNVIRGENYGLGAIFNFLNKQNRINAINNGIVIKSFDANLIENLGKFTIASKEPIDITKDKKLIKQFLNYKYKNLNKDPEALWFLYIGRFAQEKGIDLLPVALETIGEKSGNLIIIGCYVAEKSHNTTIQNIINYLKIKPHVVVIDNHQEQYFFGKYFRAACDFTITPSYQEACGLIPMEAMANYSIPLSSDVQGLQDTVIPLNDNATEGTGFVYHYDQKNVKSNLQNIINIAQNKYLNWQSENKINPLLFRLHNHAKSLDWQDVPTQKYLTLYGKTIHTNNQHTPYIIKKFPTIKILHVALEYNQASLGGIGTVTTQLIQAQNKFANGSKLKSSIITPYYLMFTENAKYLKEIKHVYNKEQVSSEIYLIEKETIKHYLVKPKEHVLFNCNHPQQIYKNNNDLLIKRIQYFNTAVANFIANHLISQIDIIQLHDWPTAITAILLKKTYNIYYKKIIYTMHINNTDSGIYTNQQLNGIDLDFSKPIYSLKQLGIEYSDYLITVSANLLQQCESSDYSNKLFKELNKSFLLKKYTKNSSSILNGINFHKYCPLDKLIDDPSDLVLSKYKIKQKLASMLSGNCSLWKIDPNLPVILYIGRFSKEKGIDCFKKIIKILEKKAIFFAIGKGINKEILEVIMQSSRQQDNVFITFSEIEQQQYGDLMRAAADFSFVPSYEEACGLVAMEGLANGSMCITSGVGGLKDFITSFNYNNGDFSGNGFFYQKNDENSLSNTMVNTLSLWEKISNREKHKIHLNLIEEAKKFDWLASNGAVEQYYELFKKMIAFQEPNKPGLYLKHLI